MNAAAPRYAFGAFTVDVSARVLRRDGRIVPLNGKAFELLLLFVERAGAALTRDELYERLWPGGIVEDGNLSQNVYLVRRALEPDGGAFIETIPRLGYRFKADVSRMPAATLRGRQTSAVFRAAGVLLAVALVFFGGSSAMPGTQRVTAQAQEAYALANYHLHLRTPTDLQYARGYFERAIRVAPQAPAGYAGLAAVYALLAEYFDGSPRQRRYVEFARAYRDRALMRDSQDSDALAAAGFIAYRFDQTAEQAQQDLTAAIASNPSNAAAHHWLGVLLLAQGRTANAVAEFETAHRLDPSAEIFARWLARGYAYAGRADDALAIVTDALRIEPRDDGALFIRAIAQEERGDLRGALQTEQSMAREPWEVKFTIPGEARLNAMIDRTRVHALQARVDEAVARRTADPFESALFYFTIGMRDRGLALLRKVQPSLIAQGLDRNDPRYLALCHPEVRGLQRNASLATRQDVASVGGHRMCWSRQGPPRHRGALAGTTLISRTDFHAATLKRA